MLWTKLDRAKEGLRKTKPAYDEHCIYVGEKKQKRYTEMEKKAQTKRGKALKIYQVSSEDGQSVQSTCRTTNHALFPSPQPSGNSKKVGTEDYQR